MNAREKLDAEDRRQELFAKAWFKCQHCGGSIYAHGTPQLAHRIAKTKSNLKKYGPLVIHHTRNLAVVCQVEPCNSAMNIGNNPGATMELVALIESDIKEGIL